MVFVKVRETYDLHTTQNKMTVIAIHTPKPDIIKRNFPGLLLQCRAYRPVSADVRLACASVLPLDPLGVGTAEGDVAPEDVFNPILYKAISNKGMSQLEGRLEHLTHNPGDVDVNGQTALVETNGTTDLADEFGLYYGLLAQTGVWKHANPQQGLQMSGLRPLVYEMVYNIGDQAKAHAPGMPQTLLEIPDYMTAKVANASGEAAAIPAYGVLGKAKEFPFLNCTSYTYDADDADTWARAGFPNAPANCAVDVPYLNVVCGAIIVPPSRLHSLYFRMVCEWTLEFTSIRPISEIQSFAGLATTGLQTHYQNYSYSSAKEALTGSSDTILEKDSCMVSSNVDINKVM